LSFDLTGLPPKLEDVQSFLADKNPQAYENLVDRLLASPHYGERMAWIGSMPSATPTQTVSMPIIIASVYLYAIRHQRLQHQPAVRPFHHRTTRGRSAPQRHFDAKKLPPLQSPESNHRGRRRTAEGISRKYAADRVRTTSTAWLGATLVARVPRP